MSKKHKMVCTTLNYIELFIILGVTITGRVAISAFAFSVGEFCDRIKNLCNNCSI